MHVWPHCVLLLSTSHLVKSAGYTTTGPGKASNAVATAAAGTAVGSAAGSISVSLLPHYTTVAAIAMYTAIVMNL
jgi:TctA family transporter